MWEKANKEALEEKAEKSPELNKKPTPLDEEEMIIKEALGDLQTLRNAINFPNNRSVTRGSFTIF